MRPKGVIGLIVVILLLVGITYLISDDLIETGMERSGESIIGARVEIDNLKFSLAALAISFDRLQVTNPSDTWRNVFETGKMSFNMEWAPLAAGKVIINDISVADIRLGTKRETDGKLRGSDGQTAAEKTTMVTKDKSVLMFIVALLLSSRGCVPSVGPAWNCVLSHLISRSCASVLSRAQLYVSLK